MSKSHVMSLKPCTDVNMLFTQLVLKCMPPSPIDVTKLCKRVQKMRSKLIKLCGKAEGLLESHYSTILGLYESPLDHLNIFPYYSIYLKLSLLEFTILSQNYTHVPKKIAFIGSGPLPLTSIVLASSHIQPKIPPSTIMILTLQPIQRLFTQFHLILTYQTKCFSIPMT